MESADGIDSYGQAYISHQPADATRYSCSSTDEGKAKTKEDLGIGDGHRTCSENRRRR
jgi:hypothetical protein